MAQYKVVLRIAGLRSTGLAKQEARADGDEAPTAPEVQAESPQRQSLCSGGFRSLDPAPADLTAVVGMRGPEDRSMEPRNRRRAVNRTKRMCSVSSVCSSPRNLLGIIVPELSWAKQGTLW